MKRHYHYWVLVVFSDGSRVAAMYARPYSHGQSADQAALRSGLIRGSYFIRLCCLPDCAENFSRIREGCAEGDHAEV